MRHKSIYIWVAAGFSLRVPAYSTQPEARWLQAWKGLRVRPSPLPRVVGRKGVMATLHPLLSPEKQEALRNSATALQKSAEELGV